MLPPSFRPSGIHSSVDVRPPSPSSCFSYPFISGLLNSSRPYSAAPALCNFTVSPPMYTGAGRKITPCVLFLSLSNHLLLLKDGYLDILTQAMPTASPYEVSTRPGKTQNGPERSPLHRDDNNKAREVGVRIQRTVETRHLIPFKTCQSASNSKEGG